MGDYLTPQGETAEAGEYYQKSLEARMEIYEQSGTLAALKDLIIILDRVGDNKHALGLYDEARVHWVKAWELFQELLNLEPSAEK